MRSAVFLIPALVLAGTPAPAQTWVRTWAAAPEAAKPRDDKNHPPDLTDRTLRQVMRVSAGSPRLRVRLSNELTPEPLVIARATIAYADADGRIVAGSARPLTFSGMPGALIAAYAPMLTDPVALPVKPLQRLTVSLYLRDDAPRATWHQSAFATAWIAPGDQTSATGLAGVKTYGSRLIVSGIDVERPGAPRTVVAYGDSITDGVVSKVDADQRWPDRLAERLQRAGMTGVAVANQGIGGNRVLSENYGQSALARFDRDVLAVPGVRSVIVLEGVNDIGNQPAAGATAALTAADLIAGYRQLIARAHDRGVKIVFATLTPYKDCFYWRPAGEAIRQQLNAWIRTNREADGHVDFARAIADPNDPDRMDPRYDSGDRLHPNDAGFAAMAAAVNLALF